MQTWPNAWAIEPDSLSMWLYQNTSEVIAVSCTYLAHHDRIVII